MDSTLKPWTRTKDSISAWPGARSCTPCRLAILMWWVFPSEWKSELIDEIGPKISVHPAFADGTNVQVARVLDGRILEVLIWERGVGPTSASGTSACAVAAAAVKSGMAAPGQFEVRMEGGSMEVTVTATAMEITLTGPVQEVSGGSLTGGFLEFLRALKSSRA